MVTDKLTLGMAASLAETNEKLDELEAKEDAEMRAQGIEPPERPYPGFAKLNAEAERKAKSGWVPKIMNFLRGN